MATKKAMPLTPRGSEEDPLLDKGDEAKNLLSSLRIICMTCYSLPLAVIWSTMGLVILPAEALRLFPTDESLFLGIFLLIVGFSQLVCPLAGVLSDRYCSTWGKRRPFIFYGSLIGLVGMGLMSYGSLYLSAWAFMLGLFISMTSMNVIFTVQAAILPDVCNDQKGSASGIVACLSQAGNLVGMGWIMATSANGGTHGGHGYNHHWSYALFVVMMVIAGIITCCSFTDKPTDGEPSEPVTWSAIKRAFWLDTKGESDFFWVFVGRSFYYASVSVQAFLYYYLRDMLMVTSELDVRWRLAVLVMVAMAFAVCVCVPLGKYSEICGRLPLIYASCAIMGFGAVGYILAPFAGPFYGMIVVYVIAGIYGIGSGAYLAVDYALALDCMPKNHRGSSEALGIWGISAFLGSSIGPLIGGGLLEVFGNFGEGGHYTYPGYVALLGFGGVMSVCSAICMRFITGAK